MPWQSGGSTKQGAPDEHGKYQYHPGGDRTKAPKEAPSALNSVIVPNVNLPKVRNILITGCGYMTCVLTLILS